MGKKKSTAGWRIGKYGDLYKVKGYKIGKPVYRSKQSAFLAREAKKRRQKSKVNRQWEPYPVRKRPRRKK